MSCEPRLAVVGGLGDARAQDAAKRVRYFGSARDVGRGELVRLERALRAGGIDPVIIRTRWNGHSVTVRIRRVCRTLGIPVEFAR
ncbi:MAG: hypothetical protein EPO40_17560 [Myxococcaceae bacterium]|nr:MAG: hypothetical protein EPO40_17560 [Myxococcaceae bacterium]